MVEYEGLHLICFKCGKYGHKGEECRPEMESSTGTSVDAATKTTNTTGTSNTTSSPYGPWMLSSYARRWQGHRPRQHQDHQFSHSPQILGRRVDISTVDRRGSPPRSSGQDPSRRPIGKASGGLAHITQSRFTVLQEPAHTSDLDVDIVKLEDPNTSENE